MHIFRKQEKMGLKPSLMNNKLDLISMHICGQNFQTNYLLDNYFG